MNPVLVLSAQPTLDRTAILENFQVGKAHRVINLNLLPSGKALNTARALQALGVPVRVLALLGGFSGRWIEADLNRRGIPVSAVWMESENRTAYSVYDPTSHSLTELIEDTDGPVTTENWQELLHQATRLVPGSAGLILSGRGPFGFPADAYQQLALLANAVRVPVYVDCYGPLLENLIGTPLELLKINAHEAGNLVGQTLSAEDDIANAAADLLKQKIQTVVITSGSLGAVAAQRSAENGKIELWLAHPPLQVGAAVGSGDSMLAALLQALLRGDSLPEALRWGAAVGAANLLIPGPGLFSLEEARKIYEKVDWRRFAGKLPE